MGLFKPAWLGNDKEKSEKAILNLDIKTKYGDGKYRGQWMEVALHCPFDEHRIKAIEHLIHRDCNANEKTALANSIISHRDNIEYVIRDLLDSVDYEILLGLFDLFPDEFRLIAYDEAIFHLSKRDPNSDDQLNTYSLLMNRMVKVFPEKEWSSDVCALLRKDKLHYMYGIIESRKNRCPAGHKDHNYVFLDSKIEQDEKGNFVSSITKKCSYCGDIYTYEQYD